MALEPPLVHAPDLQSGPWINTSSPPAWPESSAAALLVSFIDFTCVNCLRSLPYLRAWHRMYTPALFVTGIHTPEFSFAHDPSWILQAAGRLGVRWPILMDNQQEHWASWAVHAWPTLFLVDSKGFIRLTHAGDRDYGHVEGALRTLVHAALPDIDLPAPLGLVRAEDEMGAVCYPITPELQADEVDHLIPPPGSVSGQAPPLDAGELTRDGYHLEGDWARAADGWQLTGSSGAIRLAYQAAEVNAVLAPAPSISSASPTPASDPSLRMDLDGRPLSAGEMGSDSFRTASGTRLRLDVPRLYNLVKGSTVQRHELRLDFSQTGAIFYAFSFGSCLMPPIHLSST